MNKIINWFDGLVKDDVGLVGGKGANLGEMVGAEMPIPPGFVINVHAYSKFLDASRLRGKINEILSQTDVNDSKQLAENAKKIQEIITNAPIPSEISNEIKHAYYKLGKQIVARNDNVFVAIRSSATAEDIPEASFAGQQATYLNTRGAKEVVRNVQRCWASLFTPRAIFYREEHGFEHMKVLIAVIVQEMVDSSISGVMFTANPISGVPELIIEAVYGLGEAIVSGEVTPDTYTVDGNSLEITNKSISTQKWAYIRGANGKTIKTDISLELQDKQKFPDQMVRDMARIGRGIGEHYGIPMDIEWATKGKNMYILQARPVTTIKNEKDCDEGKGIDVSKAKILLKGLGASPGVVWGTVEVIKDATELDKIAKGDIMVTSMTTPDMVPGMKRASAIVTNEGGITCHAAIVSRELGTPCVVGTKDATKVLEDQMEITVDATRGVVYEGKLSGLLEGEEKKKEATVMGAAAPIITATEVKVNIDFPEVAEKAAATGADGVGLLRAEHMVIGIGEHPSKLIREGRDEELVNKLAEEIGGVAEKFYPKPVWYRTLDAPTDEFRTLPGGENEPEEANPMLGWRGIRRSLDEVEVIKCEFKAIKKLREERRLTNIGVMLPLVQSSDEVRRAKEIAHEVGLEPQRHVDFGVMVETPAAVVIIDDLIDEGIDFISFGTNDLTQYTLALDRNNPNVAKLFHETHPAVLKLIEMAIKSCRKRGVKTSICGQAGSYPAVVERLVELGIDSISANIDAVQLIRETVARVEKRLLVEGARNTKRL